MTRCTGSQQRTQLATAGTTAACPECGALVLVVKPWGSPARLNTHDRDLPVAAAQLVNP